MSIPFPALSGPSNQERRAGDRGATAAAGFCPRIPKHSSWCEIRGQRQTPGPRQGHLKSLAHTYTDAAHPAVDTFSPETQTMQAGGAATHLYARPRLSVHPWKRAQSRSFVRSQLGRDLWRHAPHYSSGRKRRQWRTSINIDPIDFSLLFGTEPLREERNQQQQNFLH